MIEETDYQNYLFCITESKRKTDLDNSKKFIDDLINYGEIKPETLKGKYDFRWLNMYGDEIIPRMVDENGEEQRMWFMLGASFASSFFTFPSLNIGVQRYKDKNKVDWIESGVLSKISSDNLNNVNDKIKDAWLDKTALLKTWNDEIYKTERLAANSKNNIRKIIIFFFPSDYEENSKQYVL